jgi:hypothetical protein
MTPYTWTTTPPSRPGHYWYMMGLDHDPEIVRVFRGEGEIELSVQYGPDEEDVDWVCNERGLWSDRPIPVPRDPPEGMEAMVDASSV